MHHEKQGIDTKYFKFEELKKSTLLSNYTDDDIKFWIKHTKEFTYDDEGYVYYLD